MNTAPTPPKHLTLAHCIGLLCGLDPEAAARCGGPPVGRYPNIVPALFVEMAVGVGDAQPPPQGTDLDWIEPSDLPLQTFPDWTAAFEKIRHAGENGSLPNAWGDPIEDGNSRQLLTEQDWRGADLVSDGKGALCIRRDGHKTFKDVTIAYVEFLAAFPPTTTAVPEPPTRRGRRSGETWNATDEVHFDKMANLIAKGEVLTANAAATAVVDGGRVAGRGNRESKIRRLRDGYNKREAYNKRHSP